MNENKMLRLALISDGTQAQSFLRNLLKVIKVVLNDYAKEPIDINQIKEFIKNDYQLEFTIEEIKASIEKDRKNTILVDKKEISHIIQGEKHKDVINTYYLSGKEIQKLNINRENNELTNIVKRYIKDTNSDHNEEEVIQKLIEFIYQTLDTNIEVLLSLMNKQVLMETQGKGIDFNNNSKQIINDFLNWEDKEKNDYIFKLLSFATDYCMLTIKKDTNSIKDLFAGKIFYLDANVIFRMSGINNEERRLSIQSFIDLSLSSGIKIKYTNFTYQEIQNTISQHVNNIKKVLSPSKLIPLRTYKKFVSPYSNLDFLQLYHQWVHDYPSKAEDYQAFEKSIIRKIDNILKNFRREDIKDYARGNSSEDFSAYCKELMDYKQDRGGRYTEASIRIDINNFMMMLDKRTGAKGQSFFNVNNYFISTDNNLCEWARGIIPGTVPMIILPSIWHSLILKYKGRTENDYLAFNAFLNMRYKNIEDVKDPRRARILVIVQESTLPSEIQTQILEDIDSKLKNKHKDEQDVELIVEEAKNQVMEDVKKQVLTENGEMLVSKGEYEAYKRMARVEAKKEYKRYKLLKNIKDIGAILAIGTFVIFLVIIFGQGKLNVFWKAFDSEKLGYDITHWITIVSFVYPLMVTPILKIINERAFCNGNYEQIEERALKKVIKNIADDL